MPACGCRAGIRTGYCGSLTTFASWNLEVVMNAVEDNQASGPGCCVLISHPLVYSACPAGLARASHGASCLLHQLQLPALRWRLPACLPACIPAFLSIALPPRAVGEHDPGPRHWPVCLHCSVHDGNACRAGHRQVSRSAVRPGRVARDAGCWAAKESCSCCRLQGLPLRRCSAACSPAATRPPGCETPGAVCKPSACHAVDQHPPLTL